MHEGKSLYKKGKERKEASDTKVKLVEKRPSLEFVFGIVFAMQGSKNTVRCASECIYRSNTRAENPRREGQETVEGDRVTGVIQTKTKENHISGRQFPFSASSRGVQPIGSRIRS